MSKAFLDTSYAVALSARTDQNHEAAVKLAKKLQESSTQIVTTRAVLLEIGNALAKVRHREAAVKLLSASGRRSKRGDSVRLGRTIRTLSTSIAIEWIKNGDLLIACRSWL